MTGNEIIYDVYEGLNIQSDDTDVTSRYIIELVNQARAITISRVYSKPFAVFDETLVQDLQVQALEKTDTILPLMNSAFGISSDAQIVRTINEIPRAVKTHGRMLYTRLGPPDFKGKEFPLRQLQAMPFAGTGRFDQDVTFAFWYDERIYLSSNNEDGDYVKYLAIRGIFQDPIEVFKLNYDVEEWDFDQQYPLSRELWSMIKPSVQQSLLNKMQLPEDKTNDGDDEPKQRAPQK